MHDRQEPDGVEPTPYLPAWLDATTSHGNDHERGREDGPYEGAEYGEQYGSPQYGSGHYGSGQYGVPQHGVPQYEAPQHEAPRYEAPPYGAPQHAAPQYGTPPYGAARPEAGEFDDGPSPYEQLDRYEPYDHDGRSDQNGNHGQYDQYDQYDQYGQQGNTPAIPPSDRQYYPRRTAREERPAADVVRSDPRGAVVPSRGELRAARQAESRRTIGRPVLMALVLAVLACAGVFGYWAFTFYEGESPGVREGDCIAALGGSHIEPLDCSDASAKFVVLEVFKGAADTSTCAVVLGATNPLVVQRDGRSDVWCVGPN